MLDPAVTIVKLEPALELFHAACGGDMDDVVSLFEAMSGQRLPGPVLAQVMGVEVTEDMVKSGAITVTSKQLVGGVLAALDENDTEEKLKPVIEAQTKLCSMRRENFEKRKDVIVDIDTALEIEIRMLDSMQHDEEMLAHIQQVRMIHEAWRSSTDTADVSKFPSVAIGPQLLALDGLSKLTHMGILTEEERQRFYIAPDDDPVPFLLERLAIHRTESGSPVATARNQRVAWLARELTGEDIPPELLGNAAVVSALDAALAADLGSAARGAQIEAILGDVALGSSQVRAKAVETLIVERITAAGAKSGSPLLSGYTAVVFYAALRAVLEEDVPGGFAEEMGAKGGHQRGPGASVAQSLAALKAVRRRVNDRFFRKKWLPLESNPDIFNTLGRQLGLPPALEFLEVFGFDPELLAMLPPSAHAVLACFPLTEEYAKSVEASRSSAPPHDPAGPFFIHQSISNACGTIALVHAFANLPADSARIADAETWMPKFVAANKDKDPSGRARALEEDEGLAVAHNQMAAQGATNPADFKGSSAQGFDAVLHFVVYVRGPDGFMYELDGLKAGPVRKGDTIVAPEGLLAAAVGEIKKMLPSNSEELRLNVMALCQA